MVKRRKSVDKESTKKVRVNPFLRRHTVDSGSLAEENDAMFQDVLRFMELSKQPQKNNSESKSHSNLYESASKLLAFLESSNGVSLSEGPENNVDDPPLTQRGLISGPEASSLLLPWATKGLLRQSHETEPDSSAYSLIKWQTLQVCSRNLLIAGDQNDSQVVDVGTILTQSILNKLVPMALQAAFSMNLDPEVSTTAGSCYCLWVDRLYRPTFDLVCDSLIPIIWESLNSVTKENREEDFTQTIVVSTLRLLRTMQGKANPKKAFQVLSRSNVLLPLSDIYYHTQQGGSSTYKEAGGLAKEILFGGLFSHLHHLDGFRSMKMTMPCAEAVDAEKDEVMNDGDKDASNNSGPGVDKLQSKFWCYQESLFETMDEVLSADNADAMTNTVISATRMIPLLIEGFAQQTLLSLEVKARDKHNVKKKVSTHTGQLQFQFFARLVGLLVRLFKSPRDEGANEHLGVTVRNSVHQSLELLLHFNMYTSSDEDKDNLQYNFLQTIADTIRKEYADENFQSPPHAAEGLKILDVLARLNHLFLHEYLSDIIARCLSFSPDAVTGFTPVAVIFFSTILKIYKKLRQLDHIFKSTLQGVDTLRSQGRADSLRSLKSILQSRQVTSELALAAQTSPNAQIHQVFSDTNSWLCSCCKVHSGNQQILPAVEVAASIGVGLFSVLMRNIRVEKTTSASTDSLCRTILVESVDLLTGGASGDPTFHSSVLVEEGLILCGWTIDLQTRCIFWLGSEKDEIIVQADMPSRIIDMLTQATGSISKNEDMSVSMLTELQFLACHRIKQLHSLVHEKERVELALGSSGQSSSDYVAEAQRLTRFAVEVASLELSQKGNGSGWRRLAEMVVAWTPYSETDHVNHFLDWFFAALSTIEQSQSPVSPDNSSNAAGDRVVVLALLRDANFWEIKQISDGLGAAALRSATELYRQAIICLTGSSSMVLGRLDLFSSPRSSNWEHVSMGDMSNVLQTQKAPLRIRSLDDDSIEQATALFNRSLFTIRTLNGIPVVSWASSASSLDCFWSALKFEYLCTSIIINKHTGFRAVGLKLLCATRVTSAKILEGLGQLEANEIKKKGFSLGDFFSKVILSISEFGAFEIATDASLFRMMVSSTRKLTGAIARCCWTHPVLHDDFLSGVNGLFADFEGSTDIFVLCYSARSILKQLIPVGSSAIHNEEGGNEGSQDALVNGVFTTIRKSMLPLIRERAFGQRPYPSHMTEESILLLSDLIRHSTEREKMKNWLSEAIKNSIEAESLRRLVRVVEKDTSDSEIKCTSYLVASLALTDPRSKHEIVEQLIGAGPRLNALLEAAFCRMVQSMDGSELKIVLDKLAARDIRTNETASELRLFQLVLLNLKKDQEAVVETVAGVARFFFFEALQFLTQREDLDYSTWKASLAIASSLIIDMTKNRDIIAIREHDVALVLAHVNSVMGSTSSADGLGFEPVPADVYAPCFGLVAFFLQRFSKQLHVCVPCLMSTMMIMLRHSLYGTLSELDIMNRGQKFTRLCELLMSHKDVYKKHVLGLLLEFVHALKGDMEFIRKSSLTPAMFCLLDMLQQYEFRQLNAMMDTTGRALFRSVHQSYQKQHVYKGQ